MDSIDHVLEKGLLEEPSVGDHRKSPQYESPADNSVAEETVEQHASIGGTSQIHVASIQIPHLQLSNKDSNSRLSFHSLEVPNGGEGQSVEHVYSNEDLETVGFVNLSDSNATEEPQDPTVEPSTENASDSQAAKSQNSSEFVVDHTNLSNSCSNCKAMLDRENGRESKNFHELLPHQYYNAVTGGHTDVQIVDALSEIFKIQWTCQNYAEVYKRDDLALCLECASILTQLYKLYNEFSSLTIKSNAFLTKVINFQKDLSEENEYKNGHSNSPIGVFYDGNGASLGSSSESSDDDDEVLSRKTKLRRKRQVKKIERYGQDKQSDLDAEPDFELGPAAEDKKVYHQSSHKRTLSDSADGNCVISSNIVPPKKRSTMNEQIIKRENVVSDDNDSSFEYSGTLSKGDLEDISNYASKADHSHTDAEYDENEPLQNVMQRISGFSLPGVLEGQALECKDCEKVFLFPIQLRIHLNSQSHKEKAKNHKKRYRKGAVVGKAAAVKVCKCGKRFPTNRQLNRHMKSCTNFEEGGGQCDRCGKKFKTQGGLRIHYAAHKRDDSKYACKDCGKRFRKLEALELHEKTDHGGFKPHACPQCDKCFRLKDKLKLHIMVIHEKRKPFPCPKCEKSFRTKYHLKIHDVSQHIQGGDNSIGCSQCKRKFADREALEKHLVVHEQDKPYICSVCSKGFQTSARLRLHEKSHQEVPSCLCPVCGRAYKHIRDLKLHEVVHQDESTYRFGCGDCPRRFYRIDLLRVHQSNEQHFSAETIGPTVTKSLSQGTISGLKDHHEFGSGSKGNNLAVIEDDEEDENETDSETNGSQHITVISRPKKTRMALPNRKNLANPQKRGPFSSKNQTPASSSGAGRDRDMTVMHPHATVIYHNPAMVQLQLDQSTVVQGSPGSIRTETVMAAGTTNISNASLHLSHQQQPRYAHEIQSSGTTSYTIMNQRDARQTLHQAASLMQGIQIQPVSSTSHPHIQFSNNTIYTMRDAAGNPTINISNVGNPADPMQYDNIISFINNLG